MILQALSRRYYDTAEEESSVPFGWAVRDASFALDLDEQGVLHNLIPLEFEEGKKKLRRNFVLPQEPPGRTVAIKPAFLCDNGKYVFGLSEKADGREKRCFEAARVLYERLLKKVESPAACGVLRFYENWDPENAGRHTAVAQLIAEKKSSDAFYKGRFVFQVNGRFAHEDAALKRSWDGYQSETSGKLIRCLVSGETDTVTLLHGKIPLPGVSMGSVPLVSVNAESFASYGKSKDDPAAQVGERSAFAYVTALNALLKDECHNKRLASDKLVYWAEGGGEQEAAAFTWLGDPKEEDREKLDAVMTRATRGERMTLENCDMERPFYLLCMSPNAGRISIRFFHQSSFENVIENNMAHYRNLEISMSQNEKFHYLPPWIILSETTVKKQSGDAAPLLGGQLLHSIISGEPYPMTLYNAILTRIRAGEGVNRTKASIIKAILIRNFKESEVTTVALNEQSTVKPYVLGRLFSVLERLQAQANGSATIQSRYFTSACANPGSVFPTLLRLSVHHSAKLDNAVFFEKLKTELMGKLDDSAPFPAVFDLEEQGLFILGYYHQTQRLFTKKEKQEGTGDE